MKDDRPAAEARSISMYPRDWRVIESFAKEKRFSVSLAVRQILDEWIAMKQKEWDKEMLYE